MLHDQPSLNPRPSIAEVYRASWPHCLRLFIASSLILSVAGLLLLPLREDVLGNLLGFFVPADWLESLRLANQALFARIGGVLLFQTVAIVCFTVVSVLFFPFRDRISLQVEEQLTNRAAPQPGLHRELWYEAGLVLFAFNVYSLVYLLAYFVGRPLFSYIDVLAFSLLAVFFTLDLLSPTYFRRRLSCLSVLSAYRLLPLQLLLFGVTFCLPVYAVELALGSLVTDQDNKLILGVALVIIVVINCALCTFALPLGTVLALRAIHEGERRDPGESRALLPVSFL